jgi:hypothetical protein
MYKKPTYTSLALCIKTKNMYTVISFVLKKFQEGQMAAEGRSETLYGHCTEIGYNTEII